MTVPTTTLNTGAVLPLVGLGCWMGSKAEVGGENPETLNMVAEGLKAGYRHFDTAAGYGNEKAVGKAIKQSGIPRSEIFITTKLDLVDHGRVAEALDESLKELGDDYVDLYLVHWPQAIDAKARRILRPTESPTVAETWTQMEAVFKSGKAKAIGVSNFSVKVLSQLLETAKVVPAVNQIQIHPYLPNAKVVDYCVSKGIHVTAYSPLGQYNSPLLTDETIVEVAKKNDKTVGQVLLSWGVQRGLSTVPKSANPTRLAQNIATFTLPEEDFIKVSSITTTGGKPEKSLADFMGGVNLQKQTILGWSFEEEMGWEASWFNEKKTASL